MRIATSWLEYEIVKSALKTTGRHYPLAGVVLPEHRRGQWSGRS
jgi:hypothetical protein